MFEGDRYGGIQRVQVPPECSHPQVGVKYRLRCILRLFHAHECRHPRERDGDRQRCIRRLYVTPERHYSPWSYGHKQQYILWLHFTSEHHYSREREDYARLGIRRLQVSCGGVNS